MNPFILAFRHGQIDNRIVHSELFRDVHRILDRSGGMLEKIAREYYGHRNSGAVGV